MSARNDVLSLLRMYSLRKRSHSVPFSEFVSFVQRYANQKKGERESLGELTSDTELKLVGYLEELEKEQRCSLEYQEGKIHSVDFRDFFHQLVKQQYAEIEEDPEKSFPTEQNVGANIREDSIVSVDVKGHFVQILSDNPHGPHQLLRLTFPEEIGSILAASDLLEEELLRTSHQRIRLYLNTQQNAYYMLSKLKSLFPGKQQILKDMINNILTQRQQAFDSLTDPTEMSFSFWTHLANEIIKEYKDKTSKLEREHMFCQAAYLTGFYAVHYNSIKRKQKDVQATIKKLDQKLRQPPYAFTVTDITNFTDENGVALTKKIGSDRIHQYLEKKTKADESDQMPEIIRLRGNKKNEFFVCKELVLPLTLKKTNDASRTYRKQFLDEFKDLIRESQKSPEMQSDEAFVRDLQSRVEKEAPLLSSLLSYELLYLVLQEVKPRYEINAEINRILDTSKQQLASIDEVLKLYRKDLLNQAKMQLPFWMSTPVLNKLVAFLKRFATGRELGSGKKEKSGVGTAGDRRKSAVAAGETSSAGSADRGRSAESSYAGGGAGAKMLGSSGGSSGGGTTAQGKRGKSSGGGPAALQKQMSRLKLDFAGSKPIDKALDELIEKWNPLYDEQAKANLVADVNSLVRDFLRKLKKGFLAKPPDAQRIRTMAETLADNSAFSKIKRKEDFKRYIELYMIKALGGK